MITRSTQAKRAGKEQKAMTYSKPTSTLDGNNLKVLAPYRH